MSIIHRKGVSSEPLGRDLVVVLIARGAMSGAQAIAGVVVALYLADIGFSALRIGMLFLGVALTTAVLSTLIGLLSDALGRKVFLVLMPLLAAGAAAIFATSQSSGLLFVVAALGGFGRGSGAGAGNTTAYQPAESAYIAERIGAARRATAFGRLTFASSLGAMVGGLLAALAHPARSGSSAAIAAYRPAFIAAAVLAGAAGLLALVLSEPPRLAGHRPKLAFSFPRKSWPMLWRFWITNGMNGMAIGMFGPFVAYWFHRRYGASPAELGVLFAVINAATLASSLAAAGIGRRLGTVRAIAGVRFLQGALLIPMVLSPSFFLAGGFYLLRMLVQRVGLALRQSFTQDVADPAERASLAALSNLPSQGTQAGSQVLAGYLFEQVSLSAPMLLSGAIQALNGLVYLVLFRPQNHPRAQASEPEAVSEVLPPPGAPTVGAVGQPSA